MATSHLRAVFEYIARENATAAETLVERIFSAVERLERYPQMGRVGRVHGTRELIITGTPYVVPYRVRRDQIEVLAVFHAARRWPDEF
jgi:toxin ParE1/3/4